MPVVYTIENLTKFYPQPTRPVNRNISFEIRQGETGAPSDVTVGALRDVPWTELKQAKWDLRRMLAHHGKGVPFNLFTLCELKYSQPKMTGFNRKGLLRCNEDMTVSGPKPAYYAAQRVFSIFDDSLERIADFKFTVPSEDKLAVFGYRKKEGGGAVVDSGFERRSRFDAVTGTTRLELVRISQASAAQRRGRAGRLGPAGGRVPAGRRRAAGQLHRWRDTGSALLSLRPTGKHGASDKRQWDSVYEQDIQRLGH